MTTLEKIASKHQDWLRIVRSFGCEGEVCEDVVQEAYLKIHTLLNKGLDISYDDDINYFYMYRTLKSLFLDLCRKESKIISENLNSSIRSKHFPDIKRLYSFLNKNLIKNDLVLFKGSNSVKLWEVCKILTCS